MLKFYHRCELLRLRWKTFTWRGGRTLWVNSLPSPHMSKWHSLSLCLQGFLCKVFLFSSVKMHLFPQVTFKIFTLSLVISSLNIKCLVMWVFFLLVFILPGVPWASWTYSWMSVPNKKKITIIIAPNISFFPVFTLLYFWNSNYVYVTQFDIVPQLLDSLFSLFFLSVSVWVIMLWPIFNFNDAFFSCVKPFCVPITVYFLFLIFLFDSFL